MSSIHPTAVVATPLLLITGFLGSGKTTFINRLLALPGQPRLGVVVNEFGQVGIDGTLLGGAGSGILELANGCVCCAKGTEMWEAALELVDRAGAEVLLIETSGLVEPGALLSQHRLLPPAMARRIDLRGLLCLVDAPQVGEAIARRPEAKQQLVLADRLLLSKLDLASPNELLATHRLLDELHATSERASLASLTPAAELANLLRWALAPLPASATEQPGPRHTDPCPPDCQRHRHGGRQLSSVSLYEPEPLLADPLLQLLQKLRGEVLRVKGIVRLLGAPWQPASTEPCLAELQLAGRQVELLPLSIAASAIASPGSNLVFIGEDLDENWLRLRLSACRSRAPVPTTAAHSALRTEPPRGGPL
jgi:G3E family GTPase